MESVYPTSYDIMREASYFLFNEPRMLKKEELVYQFGADAICIAKLWSELKEYIQNPPQDSQRRQTKPLDLLWWLFLTKHYPTNKDIRARFHICQRTFMRRVKPIQEAIMRIIPKHIVWKNRLRVDTGRTCKVYVDGVDCPINQPKKTGTGPFPWDTKWNSHKVGPGVRYVIASCLKTGQIVGVFGPFQPGRYNDHTIYKKHVKPLLLPGEMVEADKGFFDCTVRKPNDFMCQSEKKAKMRAAGRHEAINGRLKTFKSTALRFRHPVEDHKYFFFTAVLVYEMMFEKYGPAFDIHY